MESSVLFRIAGQLVPPKDRDGDCLRRFVETRDEVAFAELVRRHGPAVYGICRRAIGDHQLAEDSFQAVFVILARKAGTIRTPDAVGGWLFGVARHVAARAVAMRRRTRKEQSTDVLPERTTEMTEPADDSAVLESEIAKLPEGQRVAVVLCEIEGLSRAQAATRLGIAEGTLSSRLANARKQLALRLRERGIAPALAFAALTAVPPALSAATVTSATHSAATLAPTVAKLTREALHMMFLSKLKLATVAFGCALALWGGFGGGQATEGTAKPGVTRRTNAPVPKPVPREGVILISSFNDDKPLEIVKPDGTGSRIIKPEGQFQPGSEKLSPDGKRVVYADLWPMVERPGLVAIFSIRMLDLEAVKPAPTILVEEAYCPTAVWAADGKSVYYSQEDSNMYEESQKRGEKILFQTIHYDPATDKKTQLKLPAEHAVIGVSRDGKTLLTKTIEFGTDKQAICLTPAKTLKPELSHEFPQVSLDGDAFSPDWKYLIRQSATLEEVRQLRIVIVELATKKERPILLPKEAVAPRGGPFAVCWSPDGKRIAYHWHEEIPQPAGVPIPVPGAPPRKWTASRVTVCDLDGSNSKVIVKREYNETIMGLDWR